LKYYSTKLSLSGKDLKSEENLKKKLDSLAISSNNEYIQISYKNTMGV